MSELDAKHPGIHMIERVTPFRPKAAEVVETWSPLQLLEELVAEVKAGTVNPQAMAIHWLESTDNGTRSRPRRWQCGLSRAEEIALLEMSKLLALEDWRS